MGVQLLLSIALSVRVTHFCGETGGGEGTLVGVQLLLSIALSGQSYSLLWGDRRRGGDPGGCAAAAVDSTIGVRVTHFCGETGGEGTLVGVQLLLSIALSGLELLTFVGRQEERGPWWVCSCCCR